MRSTRPDARKRWRIISTFQRQILSKSADVADALSPRSTLNALHFTARAGQYHVADLLLRHDADVNVRDSKGRTALMEPCYGGPWKSEPDKGII